MAHTPTSIKALIDAFLLETDRLAADLPTRTDLDPTHRVLAKANFVAKFNSLKDQHQKIWEHIHRGIGMCDNKLEEIAGQMPAVCHAENRPLPSVEEIIALKNQDVVTRRQLLEWEDEAMDMAAATERLDQLTAALRGLLERWEMPEAI